MSQAISNATPARNESWEDPGDSVAPDRLAASLGVTRQVTETYSVGDCHYTSLTDAVAQARRVAKLERELL
jgi:hypothetical protein